ncbi:MAG: thioredoxin domain-containing protein [Myxococcaceae bacterium]|nr:thioredoxin domain-containing protein [Myxococcaceae bacterium]MCI0673324.1 thioredoxin domain-containing protein [Myxococcaceae bacterium]
MDFSFAGLLLAGTLTFLSPCILPLVPFYLSLLGGTSVAQVRAGSNRRAILVTAAAFCLGLAAVFVALGMAATTLGRALSTHRTLLLQVGGVLVLLFGLKALGLLRLPWAEREVRPWMARVQGGGGLLGAFLFGAAFALGWTPCVGPVLGSVLTYAASASSSPWQGGLYLATYAAGLCAPLLATAAAAPVALRLLERAKTHLPVFERVSGALLVVLGVFLLTDSLGALTLPDLSTDTPVPVAQAAAPAAPAAVPGASGEEAVACTAPADGSAGPCAVPEAAGLAAGTEAAPLPAPGMVEFVSRTCPVCQHMAPVVESARHSCAEAGGHIVQLDVGTSEGAAAAARHGVRGVPTFLFLDERGQEVARLIGAHPQSALERSLESATGAQCGRALPPALQDAAAHETKPVGT